ncbi:MAG: hypothetical protein AAB214_01605, partial [Fibrobacterota bacterium]
RAAQVLSNIRRSSITYKHPRQEDPKAKRRDTRRTSCVTVLPHDPKHPTQLRIRVEVRPDLLNSVKNKSRSAKWTLRELCNQHQQLHRRVIAPLVERLQDYRPSRCVLAPASWPPACKRAFSTWIAGHDVRCDTTTWRRLEKLGVNLSSRPSPYEIDALAARILTAADLRAAAIPCVLELREAKPDTEALNKLM